MTLSLILLALSVVGAVYTANAFRPFTWSAPGLVWGFFASWLTSEMPFHHILWQGVALGVFAGLGAFAFWPAWVALAITLASWYGLWLLWRESVDCERVFDEAIAEIAADVPASPMPFGKLVMPFYTPRPGVVRQRNIEYGRAGNYPLRLDLFRPAAPPEPGVLRPAVLQLHGGGWVIGDKREQGLPLCNHLAANGFVVFNANYRLSPRATFPDHLIDAKRALAWIREHAAEYGVDPDFVAVTGGSAGGHLTALMSVTQNDPAYQPGFEDADTSVQAAVPVYAVYDFTDRLRLMSPGFHARLLEPLVMKARYAEVPERFVEASPLDRLTPDAPPMLIVHGERDILAPPQYAEVFAEALGEVSRNPVYLAMVPGAQHAFDVFASSRTHRMVQGVERFLRGVHGQYTATRALPTRELPALADSVAVA